MGGTFGSVGDPITPGSGASLNPPGIAFTSTQLLKFASPPVVHCWQCCKVPGSNFPALFVAEHALPLRLQLATFSHISSLPPEKVLQLQSQYVLFASSLGRAKLTSDEPISTANPNIQAVHNFAFMDGVSSSRIIANLHSGLTFRGTHTSLPSQVKSIVLPSPPSKSVLREGDAYPSILLNSSIRASERSTSARTLKCRVCRFKTRAEEELVTRPILV